MIGSNATLYAGIHCFIGRIAICLDSNNEKIYTCSRYLQSTKNKMKWKRTEFINFLI